MSLAIFDRPSLYLELGGRVLFALLAFTYFLGIPAELWAINLPVTVAGLILYLGAQAALFTRQLRGRNIGWIVPAAALTDAVAVLGAVACDPYPVPPSLLLVLIAALNLGLRQSRLTFVAAVAGAGVLMATTPGLRAQLQGEVAAREFLFALAFILACLVYFALQAWRRHALQTQAAHCAEQDVETQLLNRRGFESAARFLVPLLQRTQSPLVVMLASLDTQTAKPLAARTLASAVRRVAHLVRQRARRSDVVARLSEDEFLFMLFDTPLAGGETLARALLEDFNAWAAQQTLDARITFAMIVTPEGPVAIDQLIARARHAVQRAQKHPSSPGVVTAPPLR